MKKFLGWEINLFFILGVSDFGGLFVMFDICLKVFCGC